MKKIWSLILILMFISLSSFGKDLEKKKIEKIKQVPYKAILLGDESGRIYYSKNIEKFYPLASLTKMMTIVVTFDEIERGKLKLSDRVKISKKAATIGGSKIPMKEGDIFTLEDLIKATGIYSANNAAYTIAEYVSNGNIENFVKKMNDKAKEIGGEKELKFYTPHGLPSHMTKKKMDIGTIKGIYLLSISAEKYGKYMEIASLKESEIENENGEKIKIKNRNHLLGKNGIYGIKTGNHSKIGYNISVVANKKNIKIFTIVLGSPSAKVRDENILKNINKFYEEYSFRKVLDRSRAIGKVSVFGGEKEFVELYPEKEYEDIFFKDSDIKILIKKDKRVIAPIEVGEKLGEYKIIVDENIVQEGNLVAKERVNLNFPFKKYFIKE